MLPKTATVADVQGLVETHLGIKLKSEEAQSVVDSAQGKHPLTENEFMRSLSSTVAAVIGNHTKVGWTSLNHTSDHVLVTADLLPRVRRAFVWDHVRGSDHCPVGIDVEGIPARMAL